MGPLVRGQQVERKVNKYQHKRIHSERTWHNSKCKMQLMLVSILKAPTELEMEGMWIFRKVKIHKAQSRQRCINGIQFNNNCNSSNRIAHSKHKRIKVKNRRPKSSLDTKFSLVVPMIMELDRKQLRNNHLNKVRKINYPTKQNLINHSLMAT